MVKADTILFCADIKHIDEAKEYIKRFGLTNEDVSLMKATREDEEYVRVVAKKELEICEKVKY